MAAIQFPSTIFLRPCIMAIYFWILPCNDETSYLRYNSNCDD